MNISIRHLINILNHEGISLREKQEYLKKYNRLINTIEWIDDQNAKFEQIYSLLNDKLKKFR